MLTYVRLSDSQITVMYSTYIAYQSGSMPISNRLDSTHFSLLRQKNALLKSRAFCLLSFPSNLINAFVTWPYTLSHAAGQPVLYASLSLIRLTLRQVVPVTLEAFSLSFGSFNTIRGHQIDCLPTCRVNTAHRSEAVDIKQRSM